MVVVLRDLLTQPALGLTVRAGTSGLDRQVRWVATSEHPDPSAFLQGGELLLTTGLRLPRTAAAVQDYVDRLVGAGVVGLGFGTGLVYDQVPQRLVAAAEDSGLVLFDVDLETPFVAISKTVSDLLAQQEYAEVTRANRSQQELARAAVRTGPRGVVKMLAARVGAWVVLLDAQGQVREGSPSSAADLIPALAADIAQLRRPGPAALSTTEPGRHVEMQPLGSGRRPQGFLVVGTDGAPSPTDRSLLTLAAALLSFGLDQEVPDAEERRRQVALLRLTMSGPAVEHSWLADLGGAPLSHEVVIVVAVDGPAARRQAWCDTLSGWGSTWGDGRVLCGVVDDLAYAVFSSPDDAEEATGLLGRAMRAGVSESMPAAELSRALGQAARAASAAKRRGVGVLNHAALMRGALSVADPAAAAEFAAELLAPLHVHRQSTGVDLIGTLRGWLRHHGHLDPAAAELGVHRHTIRHRVRRAAELLGRDLDDVDARMDLWFALRASPVNESGPRSGSERREREPR